MVLSPPAETDLGAIVARGRSARFSILFSSTLSACSELLATPPQRASPSSSLLYLLVPISLFEFSLYPRLRALPVSLIATSLSTRLWSIRCSVTFLPPSPSENEKENITRTSIQQYDIAIVEHYNSLFVNFFHSIIFFVFMIFMKLE
ncbi:uncharacterized protein LOC107630765 [Arachis ipaensis]|uniref:uncharacterized protein LOC107630765 n=1 Tax=Arachis ipaensis TaxID=130454 RepID=UPI0007AF2C20|nr:uncharacterized protein LOC107630765 [Arachis ipaensis]